MDETYHSHFSLEDGAGGGSDYETCRRESSKVDSRSKEIGIIPRDQKKSFRIEFESRWLKRTLKVNRVKDKGGVCPKTEGL